MLQVIERVEENVPAQAALTLPFELRQKSRLRAQLDDGTEVALLLPRGMVLRHGDRLRAVNGLVIEVRAAAEAVSTAFTKDTTLLARACYHLGNRHVPLQIGDTWLRYVHDHVLDRLVTQLGLRVFPEQAPFEPEAGAYAHAEPEFRRLDADPHHHHDQHAHDH
jgi:urease accessory protein